MNLYNEPALYDLEYDTQTEDVIFYVKTAHQSAGKVLELGCGNGRITLPIARSGLKIIGLDNNPKMLTHFRNKLSHEPESVQQRVQILEADYRDIPNCGLFSLILLPFNALHHCNDHHDVLKLLECVKTRLTPNGRFVLDCYLPDPVLYQRDPNARYAEQSMIDPRTKTAMTSWETSWYDALAQVHHVTYVYQRETGEKWEVQLKLRMFYPQELRALIDLAGFRVVNEASDFRGTPLDGQSLKWILELQAK